MSERLDDILFRQREERRKAAQQQRASAPVPDARPMGEDRASRYAAKALASELADLGAAPEGTRNDQLNKSAFNLGQLVGAGSLNEQEVRAALRHEALAVGLEPSEVDKSISSGLGAGVQHPRLLTVAPDPSPTVVADNAPPPPPPPEPSELEDFWNSSDLLWHLHQYAKARRCSPWAVLGVVLARIAAVVPVNIVLPPIVGGQASLNYFVGLVGPSGSGKGAAERVGAEALAVGYVEQVTTGSGEGIGHAYKVRKDGVLVWRDDRHSVLFSVPEIDTLSSLGARKGATLLPELRRAWSGEQLGFAYADPSKRLVIEEQQYRLCLVAGIQPTRAGALLDDADGGTPQRFLWCDAIDADTPDNPPPCPAPRTWQGPSFQRNSLINAFTHGRMEVPVCELARTTIDRAFVARRRGEAEALDGHLLLAQLKTAALLAILDGRLEVADADWHRADLVVRQSTATRNHVVAALRTAARTRNIGQAEAEAERALVVSDRQHEAAHKRVCRNVLRHLAQGEVVAHNDLRRAIAGRDRKAFEEAVQALIDTGQVVREGNGQGSSYHRA